MELGVPREPPYPWFFCEKAREEAGDGGENCRRSNEERKRELEASRFGLEAAMAMKLAVIAAWHKAAC